MVAERVSPRPAQAALCTPRFCLSWHTAARSFGLGVDSLPEALRWRYSGGSAGHGSAGMALGSSVAAALVRTLLFLAPSISCHGGGAAKHGRTIALGANGFRASTCWVGPLTFPRCCLAQDLGKTGGDASCWSSGYDFQRCCLHGPLLSGADLAHLRRQAAAPAAAAAGRAASGREAAPPEQKAADVLQCRPSRPKERGMPNSFWHDARAALTMRAWSEAGPFYLWWMQASDTENVASCPLGVLSLLVLALQLFTLAAGADAGPWEDHHAFRWAEEAFSVMLAAGDASLWLRIAASGWPLAMLLERLVQGPFAGQPLPLRQRRQCGTAAALAVGSSGGPRVAAAGLPAPGKGPGSFVGEAFGGGVEGSCVEALEQAAGLWLEALDLAKGPLFPETVRLRESLVRRGAELLTAELNATARPLLRLAHAAAELGLLRGLEAVARSLPLELPLASLLGHGPGVTQDSVVLAELHPPFAGAAPPFAMRLFTNSEVISDSIRHSLAPVCGMVPFVRILEAVARAAVQRCPKGGSQRCRLSVLEGGANLGSCLLWAGAALRAAGAFLLSVAAEPMLEAARLFQRSITDNALAENIHLERRALTAPGEAQATLQYVPGRHGQASLAAHSHSGCGVLPDVEVGCVEERVQTTTVDEAWMRRFGLQQQVDVLKLNVNGEEMNALRGARRLLSRRRICITMLHVFKVQYAVSKDLETLWAQGEATGIEATPSRSTAVASGPVGHPAAKARERVKALAVELHGLLADEAGMELVLHLEPPAPRRFRAGDADYVPLRSAEALARVLMARGGQEVNSMVAALLSQHGRSPRFAIEDHLSQVYLVARLPRSIARCRYVAHSRLPTT